MTLGSLFCSLILLSLLNCVASATIAAPSEITPEQLSLLKIHIEFGCLLRVIQDRIDETVVSHVAKVILVSKLLILSSDLFLLKFVWALFSHLSAIEVVRLLFLQSTCLIKSILNLLFLSLTAQIKHGESVPHQIELNLLI